MGWGAIDVRKIAATTATNANLLAKHISMVQDQYFFAQLTSNASAEKTCRTPSDNNGIPWGIRAQLSSYHCAMWSQASWALSTK
jgi:hypothetical protein